MRVSWGCRPVSRGQQRVFWGGWHNEPVARWSMKDLSRCVMLNAHSHWRLVKYGVSYSTQDSVMPCAHTSLTHDQVVCVYGMYIAGSASMCVCVLRPPLDFQCASTDRCVRSWSVECARAWLCGVVWRALCFWCFAQSGHANVAVRCCSGSGV